MLRVPQHDTLFFNSISYFCAMIVYNETLIVEEAVFPEWLVYMKTSHIPAVMATGFFESYRILNVLDSPNEGMTCCIQYNTATEEQFAEFYEKHLQGLHLLHHQRYENKYVLYTTLMETID
jgi:hypothetical protein